MPAWLMLALDWRSGTYGLPATLWLAAGWFLVSAGAVTLVVFVLQLLRYSLAAIVIEHAVRARAAARGYRVRDEAG